MKENDVVSYEKFETKVYFVLCRYSSLYLIIFCHFKPVFNDYLVKKNCESCSSEKINCVNEMWSWQVSISSEYVL